MKKGYSQKNVGHNRDFLIQKNIIIIIGQMHPYFLSFLV